MANPTTLYNLPDGRRAVNVTENKTLVAADSGIVQNVIADGVVVTLPSTALGANFTVRNGGDAPAGAPVGAGSNQSMEVTVSPAAADGITGVGLTAATNKDVINTQATSVVGDEIQIQGTGAAGAAAWVVQKLRGIWAREA